MKQRDGVQRTVKFVMEHTGIDVRICTTDYRHGPTVRNGRILSVLGDFIDFCCVYPHNGNGVPLVLGIDCSQTWLAQVSIRSSEILISFSLEM